MSQPSRREFFGAAAAALLSTAADAAEYELDFPLADYHVHLTPKFTLEDAIALSKQRGVKFGILEHAGTKENLYPAILSSDRDLERWLAKLDGKPVYKGVQAEWIDWMTSFSRDVVAQLDFVLSDAMTMPDRDGHRTKMWLAGFDPGDPREFMDRYVKWNVEVIEREPLDIFSHPTWLPAPLQESYDQLWTPERMKPIIDALKRTGTALEMDSSYNLPRRPFLDMAREARLKFSFGSNMGSKPVESVDFCIAAAKALRLTKDDMFVPAPRGRKPIQRRQISG